MFLLNCIWVLLWFRATHANIAVVEWDIQLLAKERRSNCFIDKISYSFFLLLGRRSLLCDANKLAYLRQKKADSGRWGRKIQISLVLFFGICKNKQKMTSRQPFFTRRCPSPVLPRSPSAAPSTFSAPVQLQALFQDLLWDRCREQPVVEKVLLGELPLHPSPPPAAPPPPSGRIPPPSPRPPPPPPAG